MGWTVTKSTSVRGIERNILRNDLLKANRRLYHGRSVSEKDRLNQNAAAKENVIRRGQSIFGAMFRRKPKETVARKTQGK